MSETKTDDKSELEQSEKLRKSTREHRKPQKYEPTTGISTIPSTSRHVPHTTSNGHALLTMRQELPRTFKKVFEMVGSGEFPESELFEMIEDRCVEKFHAEEQEMYRSCLKDDSWRVLVQEHIDDNFKKIKRHHEGQPVYFLRKILHKKSAKISVTECVACKDVWPINQMIRFPKNQQQKALWINRLRVRHKKIDENSMICKSHFPSTNMSRRYKNSLPEKREKKSKTVAGIEQNAPEPSSSPEPPKKEKRMVMMSRMRDQLPQFLQEICDEINDQEITRKQLDQMIERRYSGGIEGFRRKPCHTWFVTSTWRNLIQGQIDAFFDTFYMKNQHTGEVVEHVEKKSTPPVIDAKNLPKTASEREEKRMNVLDNLRNDLPNMLYDVYQNMSGFEIPKSILNQMIIDKFLAEFDVKEKKRYTKWFEQHAWQTFIHKQISVYFVDVKTEEEHFLRKKTQHLTTISPPSYSYIISIQNNSETNDKIISNTDLVVRDFLKTIHHDKSEEQINELFFKRLLMIDEMRKMIEEHVQMIFMGSKKIVIQNDRRIEHNKANSLNYWNVGCYENDEDVCLFHNSMIFYRMYFRSNCILKPLHNFNEFVEDITSYTNNFYHIMCQQDGLKEGPALFEYALNRFVEQANVKVAEMAALTPRPKYMPFIEGVFNYPELSKIRNSAREICRNMKVKFIKKSGFLRIYESIVGKYWKMNNFSEPKLLFNELQNVFDFVISEIFERDGDGYNKIK